MPGWELAFGSVCSGPYINALRKNLPKTVMPLQIICSPRIAFWSFKRNRASSELLIRPRIKPGTRWSGPAFFGLKNATPAAGHSDG
jgi:hypothetical protein